MDEALRPHQAVRGRGASPSGGGRDQKERDVAKEKVNPGKAFGQAGMGSSRGGKGRSEKTGVYKKAGKKARRAADKREARQ